MGLVCVAIQQFLTGAVWPVGEALEVVLAVGLLARRLSSYSSRTTTPA